MTGAAPVMGQPFFVLENERIPVLCKNTERMDDF